MQSRNGCQRKYCLFYIFFQLSSFTYHFIDLFQENQLSEKHLARPHDANVGKWEGHRDFVHAKVFPNAWKAKLKYDLY